jgi:hypothetical protein
LAFPDATAAISAPNNFGTEQRIEPVLEVLLVVVVLAVSFLLIGVPVAFALRRAADGWGSLVIDAVLAGLVLVTLAVSLYGWIGWAGPILVFLLWVAAIVWAVVSRVGFPVTARPDRAGFLLIIGWVVVGIVAVVLRMRQVNFLPWVGDMGAYVNWANEYARLGSLHASWPPYFSSYLAISAKIFGTANTTAGVPLAGLLLVFVVARVARALGAGRWASLIAAAAVTVGVEAIWYSSFPASESLAAPLFIAWIGTIIGVMAATGRRRVAFVVAAGVLMLAIGLLRGDGPISAVPLLALAILSIIVKDWRGHAWAAWLAFTASLVGALGSYWYGIQRIPKYYIATQVKGLMPHSLFRLATKVGLFSPTIKTAIILIVISAIICGLGLFFARRYADRVVETRVPRVLGYILAAGIFLGLFGQAFIPYHGRVYSGEVWDIVGRTGLWLSVALIFAIVFVSRAKLGARTSSIVLFLGTITMFYLALQSYRLKVTRGHAFFLYWDRYLNSEYTPVTYIVFGLALTIAWKLWVGDWVTRRRASSRPVERAVPAILAVVLALAAVVPTIPSLILVEKDTYMAGAYTFDRQLAALSPSKSTPILWSATSPGEAPGFFFPNTWMAFAKPLQRSFGYTVPNIVNLPGGDFSPDPVLSAASIEQDAVCFSSDTFTVYESQIGGPSLTTRVSTPGITFTPLGTRRSDISLLSEPPTNGDWTHLRLTVKAWTVTVAPSALRGVSCPN